jgi:prophage maintenance system killer protein
MRHLGPQDFLRIAAKLLGIQNRDAPLFIRLERMHRVLSTPTTFFAGGSRHRTIADESVQLFLRVASSGVLPEKNVQCAWLCLKHFLQINGYEWRSQHDDQQVLIGFVEEIQVGVDVRSRFAEWVDSHIAHGQKPVPDDEVEPEPDLSIYITSRITCLSEDERKALDAWTEAVDDEVARFVLEEDVPHVIGTYRPAVLPASPSTDRDKVLAGIEERLLAASGFIIVAVGGGSVGAGYELGGAIAGLAPILFLHPDDEPPSPRTESLLQRYGATVRTFPTGPRAPAAIRSYTRQWLKRECSALADSRRQREMALVRSNRLLHALRSAYEKLPRPEFASRVAALGLTVEHARALIADPRAFVLASLNQVLSLCAALDVPCSLDVVAERVSGGGGGASENEHETARHERQPALTHHELDALEQTAASDGYSAAQVVRMVSCAQASIDDELSNADGEAVHRRSQWDRHRWRALHRRLYP